MSEFIDRIKAETVEEVSRLSGQIVALEAQKNFLSQFITLLSPAGRPSAEKEIHEA